MTNSTAPKVVLYGILAILVVGVLAVAGSLGAGYFLPPEYSFRRMVVISQPPTAVWQVLTDFSSQPEWRANLRGMEQVADRDGRQTWLETRMDGQQSTMEIAQTIPPLKLVCLFVSSRNSPQMTWEFDITPVGKASQVELFQSATIPDPWLRAIERFSPGTRGADDFLRSIARKFGDPPVVQ
ncbi:MAG: SRPBCC family protein [Candidatus Acidiferrales bacterium]